MPASGDNVSQLFPTLEKRAMQAMANYQVGIADETFGKVKAIHAVIEYGKALLEGREGRSNIAFKAWIAENKLDVGEPWKDRKERHAAMKIAEVVVGNVPTMTFDACPNARPVDIMKWYRKKHAVHSSRKPLAPQIDIAYQAIVEWKRINKMPGNSKEIALLLGVSKKAVEKARHRWREEHDKETIVTVTEDQALAEAEKRFSEKSRLTLADAVRVHKTRLDKSFEATVSTEVRRRIEAADDHVRKHLRECEQRLLQFERERGKRGIFTKRQFKQMQILCHPDNSASPELRAELLQILVRNELSLVNPEKE
jgi:hypothetical protein